MKNDKNVISYVLIFLRGNASEIGERMMATQKKKPKFPDRIELGVGYPLAYGIWPAHTGMGLSETASGMKAITLQFPNESWHPTIPQYRLVLEKVKP